MNVGYARESRIGKTLESQIKLLKKVKCKKIFQDKYNDNIELKNMLEFLSEGDTFFVISLSVCSKNMLDFSSLLKILNEKKVNIKIIEQDFDITYNISNYTLELLDLVIKFQLELQKNNKLKINKESIVSSGVSNNILNKFRKNDNNDEV